MAGRGRPKGSHDIAAQVRGAFVRACADLEDKGKPLSTMISELLEKDPARALDTVAKFVPKEMLIETTIIQQLDEMSDEAIQGEIDRLARETADLLTAEDSRVSTKH